MKTITVTVDINYIEWDKGELEDYDWYCDNCRARLDYQDGFDTRCGEWKCTECGHVNEISLDQVVDNKPTSVSGVEMYMVSSIKDLEEKIIEYLESTYHGIVIDFDYERVFTFSDDDEYDLPENDYGNDDYELADFCHGGDLSDD